MINDTLRSLGISPAYAGKLSAFVDLFEKWNRSINLSAASSRSDLEEHVADSLHVVPLLSSCERVLDVGSGGGFPVVVAAICLPTTRFTALEPVHKKHAFLRTAARELGLGLLTAFARRLDDAGDRDFDAAMSRATFDLRDWLAMGAAHVRPGGVVLGFEAVRRDDLPAAIERHEYAISGKRRAIVVLRTAAVS